MEARLPEDNPVRETVRREISRSMCVDAGAGTGKTTLLIDRIMSLVLRGASLSRIAAITFTEKAAGELKVRLYRELNRRLTAGPPPGEESALRSALEEIEACQVSTIHSFASGIIRTRPVEARVDPGFRPASESEIQFLSDGAWSEWLREKLAVPDEVLALASALGAGERELKDLAAGLCENRDLLGPRTAGTDMDAVNRILDRAEPVFRRAARDLSALLADCPVPSGDETASAMLGIVNAHTRYERSGDRAVIAELIRATGAAKPKGKGSSSFKDNWRGIEDGFERQLETRKALFEAMAGPLAELGGLVARGVLERLRDYVDIYERGKQERGVLDFADLLIKARDLLRSDRSVRAYFQKKYDHILVDEFQDTDPLQAEIAFFLSEDGAVASDWREARLVPGKLFIVGDPKQSIFRFRRADVEVYDLAKQALLERDGEAVVEITHNFRSVPRIIDWVNAVFEPRMRGPSGDVFQPVYAPITCFRDSALEGGVTIFRSASADDLNAEELREAEAEFIASAVEDMVGRLDVRDGEGVRKASYRDFTVICRVMTNVSVIERALEQRGIPFRTDGGKNFFGRQEVADLRSLVRAIADPRDSLAVVGALRSPYFAVSDTELARFALAGGVFDYTVQPCLPRSHITAAFEVLRSLNEERNSRPVAVTLEAALEATAARETFAVSGSAAQSLANLSKLVSDARSLELGEGFTFDGFAAWLERTVEQQPSTDQSPVEEAGADFVHLMSVHKVKGLEYPVVFVAGTGSGGGGAVRFICRHADGRLTFKAGDVRPQDFAELSVWDDESDGAETLRLFYVAATRARDYLFLDAFKTGGRSPAWFAGFLNAGEEAEDRFREAVAGAEEQVDLSVPQATEPVPAAAEVAEPGRFEELERRWLGGRSLAMERGSSGVESVTATAFEEKPPEAEPLWPDFTEAGMRVGSALHAIMEHLAAECPIRGQTPNGTSPVERTVRELVDEVAGAYGVAGAADRLTEMASNVLSSGVWSRAMAAEAVYREVPYCIREGERYSTGTIDLAFRGSGGWTVVDYKSDNITADAVPRRLEFYSPQGAAYRDALLGVTGEPVEEVVFLFAAPGVEARL